MKMTFDSRLDPLELDKNSDGLFRDNILDLENDDRVDLAVLGVALLLHFRLQVIVNLAGPDHVLKFIKHCLNGIESSQDLNNR